MEFGKNRVQYQNFFWSYYKYKKFNIYFYTDGKEIADYTAQSANKNLIEFEDFFDYEITTKFDIVVYNSYHQALQSNLAHVGEEQQNNASVTRLLGNKLCVYYDGTRENLDKSIRSGIASIMINKVIYGENLADIVKSSATTSLPDWYYYGLISMLSQENNSLFIDQLKDGLALHRYNNFNGLHGEDARIAGHSIWQYIAETYGWDNAMRVIQMTKAMHSVEEAMIFVLGKTTENLIKDWKNTQSKIFNDTNTVVNDKEFTLPIKTKKKYQYNAIKISPNNEFIAYSTIESGKNKLYLYSTKDHKKKRIFKNGYAIGIPADLNYPIFTWHPSANSEFISIFFEKKGEIHWWLYNVKDKSITKSKIQYFSQIMDAEYSPDGKKFVMSAVHQGKSDIYVYDVAARSQEIITNDFFDDLHPQFIDGGRRIIFSSNRNNDTLNAGGNKNELFSNNFDLYVYDYASKKSTRFENQVLKKASTTEYSNELFPLELRPGEFTYVSDQNNTYNRFTGKFDSAITHIDTSIHYRYFTHNTPVSNYHRGIIYQSANGNNITQIMKFHGKTFLMNIPKNKMQQAAHSPSVVKNLSIPTVNRDSSKAIYSEQEIHRSRKNEIEKFRNDSDFVDVSNYIFEDDVNSGKTKIDSVVTQQTSVAAKKNNKAMEHNYDPAFQIDEVSLEFTNNYLNPVYQAYTGGPLANPGLSPLITFGTSDLLEDYFVKGAARFAGVRNNEILVSFENRQKQLDKEYALYRRVTSSKSKGVSWENVTYEATYKLTYPMDIVNRWRASATLRYDDQIALSKDDISLNTKNIQTYRTVLRAEYVHDATRVKDVNILLGERFKTFGEYYQNIQNWNKNTFILGFDYRKYISVHKNIIWANRIAGSSSLGTEQLLYYLGGVDGWILPKFNPQLDPSQLPSGQNYTFQTLASHMRGFTQNARNGNNFIVINSELRFPIIKYLYSKPLKSAWLRNLQLTGFADVGTAWGGWNPFSPNNSLNNKTYNLGGNSYTGVVNVKTQRDPLIGGIGFGLHTTLWGYYVRADWAWGIEDSAIKKDNVFYLSLNYDF